VVPGADAQQSRLKQGIVFEVESAPHLGLAHAAEPRLRLQARRESQLYLASGPDDLKGTPSETMMFGAQRLVFSTSVFRVRCSAFPVEIALEAQAMLTLLDAGVGDELVQKHINCAE